MGVLQKAIDVYRKNGTLPVLSKSVSYFAPSSGIASDRAGGDLSLYLKPLYNAWFRVKYGNGVDVMAEDWDNLIILDACRWDDFKKINDISGTLSERISRGVDSAKFVERNFQGRELWDTVYVTANPHVRLIDEDTFYAIVNDPILEWDSDIECVKPSSVTRHAVAAHQKYPNKRLIIHYMQPHFPPLGPTGKQIKCDINLSGFHPDGRELDGTRLMDAVAAGTVSPVTSRRAYRENLYIVLNEVEKLLEEIDGKSVLTSDHGEMFGERPYPFMGKLYEHHNHPKNLNVCKVPWFTIAGNTERRLVQKDTPVTESRVPGEDIEQQLDALGYK
jgi:hypothetical protein